MILNLFMEMIFNLNINEKYDLKKLLILVIFSFLQEKRFDK